MTASEQAHLLACKAANHVFLEMVREIAETHDSSARLDVARAYHFGPMFLVEIEIIMAPSTSLIESHDVGILLQHKIECLSECERCFVHTAYQTREMNDHDPGIPVEQNIWSAETEEPMQSSCSPSSTECLTELQSGMGRGPERESERSAVLETLRALDSKPCAQRIFPSIVAERYRHVAAVQEPDERAYRSMRQRAAQREREREIARAVMRSS
jgi:hypothetical protein